MVKQSIAVLTHDHPRHEAHNVDLRCDAQKPQHARIKMDQDAKCTVKCFLKVSIDVLRVRKPQALLVVQITVDLYAGLP